MPPPQPNPNIPAQPLAFEHRLSNLAKCLDDEGPIKIVAIGSSSTAGEGGIVPYPCRLEKALREQTDQRPNSGRFKDRIFDVLNKGKGGDEAPGELLRLPRDVIAEKPALVIWQIGTNAVWNGWDLKSIADAMNEGLDLLRDKTMDVVLMDPQYAPAILTDDKINAANDMVRLISDAAARANANVFRRFDLMRRWHDFERISFDRMIDPTDPDRLHQSDWSAQRIAVALCNVIVDAVT